MLQTTNTYKLFAGFYDSYVGNYRKDLDFYASCCNKTDHILEIGCGTGRVMEYFLKQDYVITGIDISPEMLNKAKVKLASWIKERKASLLLHDFTRSAMNDRFDKVLITFYTFNYIIEKPVQFLQNVIASMKDDALLLLHLFYPNSLQDPISDNTWHEKSINLNGVQYVVKDKRRYIDQKEHRKQIFSINNNETIIDTVRKYYSPNEIKNILENSGFCDISFSSEFNKTNFVPTLNEDNIYKGNLVMAKKKKWRLL